MNDDVDFVFVFVNYRDYASLLGLLNSQASVPERCRLIVVDNTEAEYRNREACSEVAGIDTVSLISPGNVGYIGAMRAALESFPDIAGAKFVALCNTDLKFDVGKVCSELKLWSSFPAFEDVGVLAPKLVTPEGGDTPQMHLLHRPSARRMRLLSHIFSVFLISRVYRSVADLKRRFRGPRHSAPATPIGGQRLFAPHGAFMIFTDLYVQTANAFDFECFLFGEEVFVGLQAEHSGLACRFAENIQYAHVGHGSMGRMSRGVARYLRDAHRWAARELSVQAATRC